MPSVPRLAIGMPVYNGARWIRDAVESLLRQRFADFELIIADNASTDDTEVICREFAARDSRVRYVRNPVNIGVFRNYDYVLELSSAPYFKWASSSDICHQGFLERCVAILDARADVVLVYPKTVLVSLRSGAREDYEDALEIDDERPSRRYSRYLNRVRLNNVMNGVMRSSAIRQTSLNRPLPGSDVSMIAELALHGRFVELPDRLFERRIDPETTAILMDTSTGRAGGYKVHAGKRERLALHAYRFVDVHRAPISMYERLAVTLYLTRRVLWLRHLVIDKVTRTLRRR